jgi:hypothetical protein
MESSSADVVGAIALLVAIVSCYALVQSLLFFPATIRLPDNRRRTARSARVKSISLVCSPSTLLDVAPCRATGGLAFTPINRGTYIANSERRLKVLVAFARSRVLQGTCIT